MKPDTIRRKFRKYGVKFNGMPDESPRKYEASDVQRTRHAEYPVALSARHKYFDPRIGNRDIEIPARISAKLTAYAIQLLDNKFPLPNSRHGV